MGSPNLPFNFIGDDEMSKRYASKSLNLKRIFIVVGFIMLVVGAGIVFVVDAEGDIPWSEYMPWGDSGDTNTTTTTTDATNTTTVPTNTTPTATTEPLDSLPSGATALRFYASGADEVLVRLTSANWFVLSLWAEGQEFEELHVKPLVIGDIRSMNGEPYTIEVWVDSVIISSGDDAFLIHSLPTSIVVEGVVEDASESLWQSERVVRVGDILSNSTLSLKEQLTSMALLEEGIDIWNYDVSITMHCDMVIGGYEAPVKRGYDLGFFFGDNPYDGSASIHSLSLADDTLTLMSTAQMLMIFGVGIIVLSMLPIGSLLKNNTAKRRKKYG